MTSNSAGGHEPWRPVVGYEGLYEVSDIGRVRSLGRIDSLGRRRQPRLMRGARDGEGYVVHGLTPAAVDGVPQVTVRLRAHVLVLTAFVGARPQGMDACHANDVPTDNRLTNLRWDVRAANAADRVRNRSGLTSKRVAGRRRRRGHCARDHEIVGSNLTNVLAGGRRRCLACQRGHNAVREAAKRGRRLDLDTECHRHYTQLLSTDKNSANPAV